MYASIQRTAQLLVSMCRYPASERSALFHEAYCSKAACRLSLHSMGTVRPQALCSMHVKLQPKSIVLWALKHCERAVTAYISGHSRIHFPSPGRLLIAHTPNAVCKLFRIKCRCV